MTIRQFLSVLQTRWRIIAACVLVVIGAAAYTSLTTVPVYEATARVYFSTTKPSTDSQQGGSYVITRQDLNTYVEVLGSPSVLGPLHTELGLAPGAPLDISATVSDLSNVLDLRATSSNPQRAADIANTAGPVLAAAAKQFSPLLALSGQAVEVTAITPATPPNDPLSPNVRRNLMLALLVGLVVGIGVALIRHVSDTKIRDEDDIKALSDRPILANIPFVKDTGGRVLSVADDPHSIHAEAVRRLRTNILFVDVTTQGHSFVVTSSNPGEGKTTTTVNLALAMADAGSKVLLIDGDLRNPSVASLVGFEGSAGLTTVLLGRAEPNEVIQQWRDSSLYVLPAGQVPPNPSELLGSEAMSQLFQKLSQEFDFILIDSPPINPVIDAVLLNQLTKGLIMVVASERIRRRDLESALTSLETVDVQVAGFALNMAAGSSSTTYRYGYYGPAGAMAQPTSRSGLRALSRRQTGRRR